MVSMIHKIALTIAVSGLRVVGAHIAAAAPMRCSGEQKQCLANCNRALQRTAGRGLHNRLRGALSHVRENGLLG